MLADPQFLAVVQVVMLILMILLLLLIIRTLAYFRAAVRENEERTIALFNALQKMHGTMNEQLGEQRRQIRVQQELLQLKHAEMTGDFEVIEEDIPAPITVAEPEITAPQAKKRALITL